MEITCCHDFVAKFPSHQILLKNSTLNWFDEKKLRGSEFHSAHQVWESTIKRDHTQKIREIDSLVTTLTKTLIWRKNVDFSVKIVIAFYCTFPHCVWVDFTKFFKHVSVVEKRTVWKNKTFSLALITKYFVKAAFSVSAQCGKRRNLLPCHAIFFRQINLGQGSLA